MKRLLLFVFYFLFFTFHSKGQVNLVPNPSFEIYSTCPSSVILTPDNEISLATGWINPTQGSPDYFNRCDTVHPYLNSDGVPYNYLGFQETRTGNAYAGFVTFEGGGNKNIREYIEIKLNNKLLLNKCYEVSFYVNLANFSNYLTNKIGAFFSSNLITENSDTVFGYIPQIENISSNTLSDTTNWIKITGSFIANGGEQYMTIGNFENDANSDTLRVQGSCGSCLFAYYYIDDVSVTECVQSTQLKWNIYPNPAENFLYIQTGLDSTQSLSFTIYDLIGQQLANYQIQSNTGNYIIGIANLASGLYIYKAQLSNGTMKMGKIIVIK